MARFDVSATPEAEEELAELIANSPPALQRDIADASNRIDSHLRHADLLPNYRLRTKNLHRLAWGSFPLEVWYEIDEPAKIVELFHYKLIVKIHNS